MVTSVQVTMMVCIFKVMLLRNGLGSLNKFLHQFPLSTLGSSEVGLGLASLTDPFNVLVLYDQKDFG